MKNIYKITRILPVLLIALSFASCKKGLMTFDNKMADIYFSESGKAAASIATDSSYVSFSYSKSPDSIKYLVVSITGASEDVDREYKVEVNPLSTAIAGIHFEALPEKLVIRKHKLADTIKLKLIRTAEMMSKSFFVKLDLLPTASFRTDFNSRSISGKIISTISTKVLFDDLIKKPKYWTDSRWGTFTRKKLFYVCDYLNITAQYLDTDISNDESVALPRFVQRHLDKLKLEGNPVLEEDGSLMTMGPSSQ
ncbi:DUF4843 domain-containing protein [Pedobacter gandavensis]|uniref:DUF4843 domain-containing protein n=1 Tax=Pedobacter gandavensis TaxID=2679963 RepID=UPI0029312108|nr:DUF4843 domain-containing protein [Pedobacter gandavensis]